MDNNKTLVGGLVGGGIDSILTKTTGNISKKMFISIEECQQNVHSF